jgi:hypothetical protein
VPDWRRQLVARQQRADQVQRIAGGDHDPFAVLRPTAGCAQARDRFRQGVLLAGEAGHEAPAAYLAARFHAPVHPHEVAPGRQPAGFALEQAPATTP